MTSENVLKISGFIEKYIRKYPSVEILLTCECTLVNRLNVNI